MGFFPSIRNPIFEFNEFSISFIRLDPFNCWLLFLFSFVSSFFSKFIALFSFWIFSSFFLTTSGLFFMLFPFEGVLIMFESIVGFFIFSFVGDFVAFVVVWSFSVLMIFLFSTFPFANLSFWIVSDFFSTFSLI